MFIKKIFIILTILFTLYNITYASQLKIENNFDAALIKAKTEHKKIIMMYSAVYCPECEYMKEVVFKNKKVSNYLQKNFIVLMLDIQKDKLPKGFSYVGIPVFFLIDENGKEYEKIIGSSRAEVFLQKIKGLK